MPARCRSRSRTANFPRITPARPKGTGFPVILVNEEIFGVHDYIKDICRRFAKLGYMAVAPEIYARIADLSKMTDVEQIIQRRDQQEARRRALSDLDATLAWAAKNHGSASRMSARSASAVAAAIPGCTRRTIRS